MCQINAQWKLKTFSLTPDAKMTEIETAVSMTVWELNSKTLFYKDCSLGSVKNLTTSPC